MTISFSRDYGTLRVGIDEENPDQDVAKCQVLEKLFSSTEWVTLLELLMAAEAKMDEAVMKVKPQEQSFRETAIYAARKNGFCEAVGLLKKAVDSYAEYKAVKKEEISRQIDEMMHKQEDILVTE